MRKVFLMLVSLLFLASGTLWALPAKRVSKIFTQPDGSTVTIVLQGDEHFHFYSTTDGIMLKESSDGYMKYATVNANGVLTEGKYKARNPEERNTEEIAYIKELNIPHINTGVQKIRALNSPIAKLPSGIRDTKFPTKGIVKGIIILAQYQDVKFSSIGTNDQFTRMMNEEGYSDFKATGSARDYFIDQSSGVFTPEFDVVGPVTLPNDMAYYGKNGPNTTDLKAGEMIIDACKLVNDQVDFSQYDQDDDGKIDLVYVIYAGYAEAQGAPAETIWPHTSDLKRREIYLDNKLLSMYACSSELRNRSGETLDGIGSFCHEYSHCLGLPDLYDTNYSGKNFSMETWDIMDHGNYNNDARTPAGYSALERYHLGWMELEVLTEPQNNLTLEALNTSNKAYVLQSDINEKEFFTLENRQQTKWDTYLPSHGLMITHIDYMKSAWVGNTVNNTIGHERVQIVPADNILSSKTLADDTYPGTTGNMSFTDTSSPAAELYTGTFLGKPITNIQENNGIITFNFQEKLGISPIALEPAKENITGVSFTAQWNMVSDAETYDIEVTPATKGHAIVAEDFTKFTSGSTSAPDATDIAGNLDEYTTATGWTGSEVYQAGGAAYLNNASSYLTTPLLDLSTNTQYTVCLKGVSTKTGFNGLNLTLSRNQTGTLILEQKSFYISKGEKQYIWVISSDQIQGYLHIQVNTPLAIQSIQIYSGDVSTLLNNGETPSSQGGGDKLIFSGISGDHYDVMSLTTSGIENGPDYMYVVYGRNGELTTPPSNKVKVILNPDAIDNVKNNQQTVAVSGYELIINAVAGENIKIYSMDGILKYSLTASEGENRMTVEKGLYLIRIGGQSMKAVVSGK